VVSGGAADDEPRLSRSALGDVYTCHVTNGMTSDRRHVRLAYDDVIGAGTPTPLSTWMSINSVTGTQYSYYYYYYTSALQSGKLVNVDL